MCRPRRNSTPKAVETAEERHNLTFRVKLQLDKNRLREYEPFVKSGLPGMGYVRFDDSAQWPEKLQSGCRSSHALECYGFRAGQLTAIETDSFVARVRDVRNNTAPSR
jgi:hypothetical protein